MTNIYPITGIPVAPGQKIPTRQEITAWAESPANKHQFSLFMQAVTIFEALPVEDTLSFFQVAGIHSYPIQPWDGAPAPSPAAPPGPGYCNHNIVTFPTWHRPYMLLFEQRLWDIMKDIIESWRLPSKEKQIWLDAANQFRLPYWDWARKQTYIGTFGLPELFTQEVVKILRPDGTYDDNYTNPLWKFQNPKGPNVPMGDPSMGKWAIKDDSSGPWSQCIATSRYGILDSDKQKNWIHGINNFQRANIMINSPSWYDWDKANPKTLAYAVSRLLSPGYFSSWDQFSTVEYNNPRQPTSKDYLSLEYIHNIVHNNTGGEYTSFNKDDPTFLPGLGHMSDVPVAAFDPIFFFHHCNVDRLCAMWQKLNPTYWMDNDNANKALEPFWSDAEKDVWTSDKCRNTEDLHYEYDDLVPKPDAIDPATGKVDQAKYVADLKRYIDETYPSTSQFLKHSPHDHIKRANTFKDYIINVTYDRYALNGAPYSINFFLDARGSSEANTATSTRHIDYVGRVYTFSVELPADSEEPSCGNCATQKASGVLSKAQIPLTVPLFLRAHEGAELGLEEGLNNNKVETWLKKHLRWEFVRLGGEVVDPARFPNTKIGVLAGVAEHPSEQRGLIGLPKFGSEYHLLGAATEGKHWGARVGEPCLGAAPHSAAA